MAFQTEGEIHSFDVAVKDADCTHSTLMGPSSYCQGYSAGGSDSCTNVPANCYIDIPIDNTVPQVECES